MEVAIEQPLNPETVLSKTEKGRIECFMEQYQKYSNGKLTCLQFMKYVWYKFGARTDMKIHVIKL
jgi:hypothetical protein